MLFSLDWLLQLCPAPRDPHRIAAALTSRGLTVDGLVPAGEDVVLEVDVPANRPDCLGHRGLAREIAAALGAALAAAERPPRAGDGAGVRVAIDDTSLCPRYTARLVRGVSVGPSPGWVQRRLEACGLRPVNNVVDVSNLVLLELGQPIHAFDLDRLQPDTARPPALHVRLALPGESLRTLDGLDRRLARDMLVIADADRALALAGVIGGAETQIGPGTRNVLVEAAQFEPGSVRSTARALGLATDASYRFERGVDPSASPVAQALAARLLTELAGGSPTPEIVDLHPAPAPPRSLTLRRRSVERLLGFAPDPGATLEALTALELAPRGEADGAVSLTVPSWRADLLGEADLVEEVARHLGYDRIPVAMLDGGEVGTTAVSLEERVRDRLSGLGFHEALGYSMIADGEDDRFLPSDSRAALSLENPIAEPLSHLRRSILPGLLRALDGNLRHGIDDVRLFEIGRVFLATGLEGPPDEPLRLGLAWSGAGEPRHWSRPERGVDLYDLGGIGDDLLRAMPGCRRVSDAELPAFHPGRSLRWTDPEGRTVARGGALHPELQRALDREAWLLEVDLGALSGVPAVARQSPIPRVPAVTRDLSLLLTRGVTYDAVIEALGSVAAPAPVRFEAVDRYRGAPLGVDESSLTVRIILEPLEHTLTDAETEAYRIALLARLEEALGVRLRS